MITNIKLNKVATYSNTCEINPNKINYVYGGNGCGKTTIAKVIYNPSKFKNCNITWDNSELKTLIYDKDFLERNFYNCDSLSGVFTLGESAKEAKEEIKRLKKELDSNATNKNGYETRAKQLEMDGNQETQNIMNIVWETIKTNKVTFRKALTGYLDSKLKYFTEFKKHKENDSNLLPLDKLIEKYNNIYSDNISNIDKIQTFDIDILNQFEECSLLEEAIVGASNSTFSTLIKELNNSDWVINGIEFMQKSSSRCPFCQQTLPEKLKESIENIVDQDYKDKLQTISGFKESYLKEINKIEDTLNDISSFEIKFIPKEKLNYLIEEIIRVKDKNLILIEKKEKLPSEIISIESIKYILSEVNVILNDCNTKIEENNRIYRSLDDSKKRIRKEVWKYLYSLKSKEIEIYNKKYKGIQTGLSKLYEKIGECNKVDSALKSKIRIEESKNTNIQYTANEINKILTAFGFSNFRLDILEKEKAYKVVRLNGDDAKNTLSEGEIRFLTFIYFYHLINGNFDSTNITQDKVIVIDDPISSLDSDILFVVSTLIKGMINKCRENEDGIKQIFILTHNVYFYKEVTFKGSGKHTSNEETYWIIRKYNNTSEIEENNENPISTTYELLWRQLDKVDYRNAQNAFNAMRRILEYYFKTIGKIDIYKEVENFKGKDKLLCSALLSLINDGSHSIYDDIQLTISEEEIKRYLIVFETIFRNMGHIEHYNMMMRTDN